MRTKLVAAAAILAAGVASSMAQSNVYSLNVVGYVNKTLTGGGRYTAVANPLNTTNNTFAGLLGDATSGIPSGSQVLKWNPALVDFDTFNKIGFGNGWSPAAGATTSLNPGEGVLVLITGANVTNTFVGEVLQGSLTNSIPAGFDMAANMVPDSGAVNTIGLGLPHPSQLLKWDSNAGAIGDWVTFNTTPFGSGWSPSVPTIDVAEAVLINAGAATNWVRNFTVAP
jgi:hypothetical protein